MELSAPQQIPPMTLMDAANGSPQVGTGGFLNILALGVASAFHTVRLAQWAELSNVPEDADWLIMRLDFSVRASGAGQNNLSIHNQQTGAGLSVNSVTRMAQISNVASTGFDDFDTDIVPIRLNPSAGVVEFDLGYGALTINTVASTVLGYLMGYGRNP